MSGPKTLAERLDWMAKNLPGFREELDAVASIQRKAASDGEVVSSCEACHAEALARIAEYAATDSLGRLDWWSHPDRALMRVDPQWSSVLSNVLRAAGSA